MSRAQLLALVNSIPEKDIELVYNTILSCIEETEALPDEIKSIKKAKQDKNPLISHDDFWNGLI